MTEHTPLEQATQHYMERDWMQAHGQDVYDTLAKAIKRESEPSQTIETLLLIYPHAINGGEVKKWSKLLQDALVMRNAYDAELFNAPSEDPIRHDFMLSQANAEMEAEFKIAMRRARKRLKPSTILEAYIDLFKSQIYHVSDTFNTDIVNSAIMLGRQVNLPDSYGELYLALGFAYVGWGDYERALTYSKLAYDHWITTNNGLHKSRSAYIIAICYRQTQRLETAYNWLDKAAGLLPKNADTSQQIAIAGEVGNVLVMQREFTDAIPWYENALNAAQSIKNHILIATANHGLGIAKTQSGNFGEAQTHFEDARAYFEEQGPSQQLAHLYHSMAFREFKIGNPDGAIAAMETALKIMDDIPQNAFVDDMRKRINEDLNNLRNS